MGTNFVYSRGFLLPHTRVYSDLSTMYKAKFASSVGPPCTTTDESGPGYSSSSLQVRWEFPRLVAPAITHARARILMRPTRCHLRSRDCIIRERAHRSLRSVVSGFCIPFPDTSRHSLLPRDYFACRLSEFNVMLRRRATGIDIIRLGRVRPWLHAERD